MTVGMFRLTGEFDGFGESAATGHVVITSTPAAIKDSAANITYVSPQRVWLRDGKFSVSLPTDGGADFSSAIRYRVTSKLRRGLTDITPIEFWAAPAGSVMDLSDTGVVSSPPASSGSFTVPFTIPFTVGA